MEGWVLEKHIFFTVSATMSKNTTKPKESKSSQQKRLSMISSITYEVNRSINSSFLKEWSPAWNGDWWPIWEYQILKLESQLSSTNQNGADSISPAKLLFLSRNTFITMYVKLKGPSIGYARTPS